MTKVATNLSVRRDLLEQAKTLHINCSAVLEAALEQEVKTRRHAQWLRENEASIATYNATVEKAGVFGDTLRLF